MNCREIRLMSEFRHGSICGDKKDRSVAIMQPHTGKNRLQSFGYGRSKKILPHFQFCKRVDNECSSRTQHSPNRSEGFTREQVRWGRIPKKCVEDHRIVFFVTTIQRMPAVVDCEWHFFWLKIEIPSRDFHDSRINFHYIHACASACEVSWHNTHAQTNAKHVIDICDVSSRQLSQ